MTASYAYRQSGTTGCEILDADGTVVAWTADVGWAGVIVGLLNGSAVTESVVEPVLSMKGRSMSLSQEEVKNLVKLLLRHRPDLVIVRTASADEKRQLVHILKRAGAKVIYTDDTPPHENSKPSDSAPKNKK